MFLPKVTRKERKKIPMLLKGLRKFIFRSNCPLIFHSVY